MSEIQSGIWQHYAGEFYQVLFVARHTETGEDIVVYLPLYLHPAGGRIPQARPAKMWREKVSVAGKMTQRFKFYGRKMPKKGHR